MDKKMFVFSVSRPSDAPDVQEMPVSVEKGRYSQITG